MAEMEDLQHSRPFNPSSREDWLRVDLSGLFDTCVIVACLLFILGAIVSFATWSNVFDILLSPLIRWITLLIGDYAVVPALVLLLLVIPSFLIVFVFRLNFTVDEERSFRYLYRWL
jgi:hypothetical protein